MHTYTVKLTYKVHVRDAMAAKHWENKRVEHVDTYEEFSHSLVEVEAFGPEEALKKAPELRKSENYEYLYGVEIIECKPYKTGEIDG